MQKQKNINCIKNFTFDSVKPTLKKVSKYENKFAKLQKKAAEFNFRNQLKVVKKKEFTLEEEEKEVCANSFFHLFRAPINITPREAR